MDKAVSALVIVVVVAVLIALMLVGWRRRGRAIAVPAPARVTGTPEGVAFDGLYLATTLASDRMQRVSAHGLGYRRRGPVTVTAAGLVICDDVLIPTAQVTGVERASWTIDRGVEPDGLNAVTWMLGQTELTTFLRLDAPEAFDAEMTRHMTGQDSK